MGRPLSPETRHRIIELRQEGLSLQHISLEVGASFSAVQSLCARYKAQGADGLVPRYSNCGLSRPSSSDLVYRAVRCFRAWHPSWGAGKICAELSQLRPTLELPSQRTLQRWFHWNGQAQRGSKAPERLSRWATSTHQGWQVDAKEVVRLKDGSENSWLSIIDEHSGGIIDAGVFPLRKDIESSTKVGPKTTD